MSARSTMVDRCAVERFATSPAVRIRHGVPTDEHSPEPPTLAGRRSRGDDFSHACHDRSMKRLSPKCQAAWDVFVENANPQALHSHDLARFARFVRVAHRTRRSTYIDFDALVSEAWPLDDEDRAELAEQLGELYAFGRQVCAT